MAGRRCGRAGGRHGTAGRRRYETAKTAGARSQVAEEPMGVGVKNTTGLATEVSRRMGTGVGGSARGHTEDAGARAMGGSA
uniref:Uncharacterized protein n=1 Tax=Oryza sativa subsp. japonica TaxID=39947 RepID=Q7XIA5_ORYSJ|nr:hypothetical protein [Oryza sativa Japonica Group]BAD30482.1 hypothetical protein [Oryza sativa Japonica Group]